MCLEGGWSSQKEVVMSRTNYVRKSSSQAKEKPGGQALGRQEMNLLICLRNQGGKLGIGSLYNGRSGVRIEPQSVDLRKHSVVKFVTPL